MEVLEKHAGPEWLRDAKFGIYTHWGPAADGTITPEAQKILLGIGEWLKINGEAIRPGTGNHAPRWPMPA